VIRIFLQWGRRGVGISDTQLIPPNFLLVLNARNTDLQVSSAEHLNEKSFRSRDLKIKRVARRFSASLSCVRDTKQPVLEIPREPRLDLDTTGSARFNGWCEIP
jgi:hypothetical protein